MTAIYKRELKSYFQSMTGYVLIAFLVIFTGIYFMAYNLNSGYPYFSYVLMNINYVLIIIIPMLTMRSFAEERKNKTDQLLLAAPVKLFDIVMGKYLAMAMEKECKKVGAQGRMIPVPRSISAGCGLSWCAPLECREELKNVMQGIGLEEEEIHECMV